MQFINNFPLCFNLLSKFIIYAFSFNYIFHCVDSPIDKLTIGVEKKTI
jgi:hypothetical protein